MQLINASDNFVRGILGTHYNKGLLGELNHFIKSMRSKKGPSVFDPSSFHNSIRKCTKKFLTYSQEDSHDLILSILDTCIEDEKMYLFANKEERKKLHTFLKTSVGSTVAFYLAAQISCLECKNDDWVFDPCLDLSLPLSNDPNKISKEMQPLTSEVELPTGRVRKAGKYKIAYYHFGCNDDKSVSIKDYIHHFMAQEALYDKNNLFKCSKCKKYVKSHHQYFILDPPECLFITLKRFKRDGASAKKISKIIKNNLTLNLTPYVINDTSNKIECKYKLIGFTSHGGSLGGGHYTAFAQHGSKYSNYIVGTITATPTIQ